MPCKARMPPSGPCSLRLLPATLCQKKNVLKNGNTAVESERLYFVLCRHRTRVQYSPAWQHFGAKMLPCKFGCGPMSSPVLFS